MIKPDKLDAGTTLKGLDYIDVPGSAKRDYKLNFFAHKEGTFGAKVIFIKLLKRVLNMYLNYTLHRKLLISKCHFFYFFCFVFL